MAALATMTAAKIPCGADGKKRFRMEEVKVSFRFLTALLWLLEGDPEFGPWQREAGDAGKLPKADDVEHEPMVPGGTQLHIHQCALACRRCPVAHG